jgi:HAD superfamily phosphoserine phosphatase-like hydrolase
MSPASPTLRVPAAPAPLAPGDVVASDLEGTLTDGETWRALGLWMTAHGRRREYLAFLAPRLALLPLARTGLYDRQRFRDRWVRDVIARLAGFDTAAMDAVAVWIVDEVLWPARREPMMAELATATGGGARVILVSGTYDPVLRAFAARMGAEAVGTPLRFEGDRFTGRLAGPVNTGRVKVERLARRIGTATVGRAYGDSIADLALLEAAASAVAVTPDRTLAAIAAERGWRVIGAIEAGAVTRDRSRPS